MGRASAKSVAACCPRSRETLCLATAATATIRPERVDAWKVTATGLESQSWRFAARLSNVAHLLGPPPVSFAVRRLSFSIRPPFAGATQFGRSFSAILISQKALQLSLRTYLKASFV